MFFITCTMHWRKKCMPFAREAFDSTTTSILRCGDPVALHMHIAGRMAHRDNNGPSYWDITIRYASCFANYTRLHPTHSMVWSHISIGAILSCKRSLKIRHVYAAPWSQDVANDLWQVGLFAYLLQSSAWTSDSYRKYLNILSLFNVNLLLLLHSFVFFGNVNLKLEIISKIYPSRCVSIIHDLLFRNN